jgi:hypothetical protein
VSGTLTVSGMSAGLLTGQKVIGPITITGNNPIGEIIDAALASGDNDFTVPTGAVAMLINLGLGPTATVKLRTNLNTGDGGLEIAPFSNIAWTVFPLVAGTTSIILNASGPLSAIELSFI